MIPLETIQVAKPCHADWDAMTGDAQVRHCGSCRQNVYNLSEMTRAQAEAVILENEGHLCVRFYTRADGTVLTQDCPVGLRAFRLKVARKLSWAAALALACLTGAWRGETAHAVTKSPPKAAAPANTRKASPPAKPHTVPPRPQVLMGKPLPPPHGWTMGAPPPPLPHATMGMIRPIPPPTLPHRK